MFCDPAVVLLRIGVRHPWYDAEVTSQLVFVREVSYVTDDREQNSRRLGTDAFDACQAVVPCVPLSQLTDLSLQLLDAFAQTSDLRAEYFLNGTRLSTTGSSCLL